MKKIKTILALIAIISTLKLTAQISINTDGTTPDSSAILDISSSSKGILIPRMTYIEIENILNPANGLMVFNTSDNTFYTFVQADGVWKEVSFGSGTIAPFDCGGQITDIDGNYYDIIQIGTQCWMAENLGTTTYDNGTSISNITNNTTWSNFSSGAYCLYDNSSFWGDSYGALYNWFAVVDIKGICPDGWHVPTTAEWNTLISFAGGQSSPNGNKLKSCRCIDSPLGDTCNTSAHPRWEDYYEPGYHGTDDYGFSAHAGSIRFDSGNFGPSPGEEGYWWSSTESGAGIANLTSLYYHSGNISHGAWEKKAGAGVRCIRD